MQDPRYKKVRDALDRLMYREHLNPDSIDLVQKILNEHTRLLQTYNKLKKKSSTSSTGTNKSEINNYQHQIDLLNEKYGQAIEENKQLRKRLEDDGIQEKIRSLETALTGCRVKYEKKLDEMSEKNSTYEYQIEQLNIVKKSLNDQNSRIRIMLDKCKNDYENSSAQFTQILQKKKKQIQKLEQQNSKYRIQIHTLEQQLSSSSPSSSYSQEQQSQKQSLSLSLVKSQLLQSEQKLSSIRIQLQKQRNENEKLRNQNKILIENIGKLKNQGEFVREKGEIQAEVKGKIQGMYRDALKKIEEMDGKYAKLEAMKQQIENQNVRLNQKVKQLAGKNKNLLGNMNKLQQQLTVLNSNYTSKFRELRESQSQKSILQQKIKSLESQLQTLSLSLSQPQVPQPSPSPSTSSLQKQLTLTQSQLTMMHQNQQKILSQKSKLQTDLKRLQIIIQQGNKNMEMLQLNKQNLTRQNRELKEKFDAFGGEGEKIKSENARLRSKIGEMDVIIEELRAGLRREELVARGYAEKLQEYEKAVEQQIQNNKQIFQDNKHLKVMVQSLQKTKTDLFQKYKQTTEQNALKQQDRLQSTKVYNKLLEQNRQLLQKIRIKQSSIANISLEYDQLQNLLDTKTIQNQQLSQTLLQQNTHLLSIEKSFNEKQQTLQSYLQKISSLQSHVRSLESNLQSKQIQIGQYLQSLNSLALQNQELQNQLSLVVLSSKEFQREAQQGKFRYVEIERKVKEKNGEIDRYREQATAYRLENQSLISQLQAQRKQFSSLQQYSNNVVEQYNKMHSILTQKDATLSSLQSQLSQFIHRQKLSSTQIAHYERKLKQLEHELTSRQDQIRRLIDQRDRYRGEANGVGRRGREGEEWRALYEDRVREVESELERRRREGEEMRAELRKYQGLIGKERQRGFELEERLRKIGDQTPIKMFYRSRVESENWNGYNRDAHELQRNSQMGINMEKSQKSQRFDKFSKNINSKVSESGQSEKVSLSSKQCYQNLDQITRQYNATLNIAKIKR